MFVSAVRIPLTPYRQCQKLPDPHSPLYQPKSEIWKPPPSIADVICEQPLTKKTFSFNNLRMTESNQHIQHVLCNKKYWNVKIIFTHRKLKLILGLVGTEETVTEEIYTGTVPH